MKIIDRNGRLFGRISVIDIVVAAVVLVLVTALYTKSDRREIISATTSNIPITYQLRVTGVRTYIADAIREGDQVYTQDQTETGDSLGKITAVEVSPGQRLVEFSDGTVVKNVPIEDSVNLLITVEGEGIVTGRSYMLNRNYPLSVNMSRNLCTRYAQFTGVVTAILN